MKAYSSLTSNRSLTAFITRLNREKTDTLILVGACLLVISNHFSSAALWISISSTLLMAVRAWLTLNGRKLPSKLILIPTATTLMAGIFFQFHSFFGREAGVAMLILLLACKMLEMHAKRDLFVVIYLGFFLLLTSFFESQSLSSAMLVMLSALALLVAQLSFQYQAKTVTLLRRLQLMIKMISLAAPLTIICFFLFPRIQGPLWGLPSDANIARSGLTDSMSPGNISKLAMSEELVFRVKFLDPAPPKSNLYWRAIVLDEFDGRTWTSASLNGTTKAIEANVVEVAKQSVRQEITMEASGNRNLFGLDISPVAPEIENHRILVNRNLEILSNLSIETRTRYQIKSYPSYRIEPELSKIVYRQTTSLPRRFNPKSSEFANEINSKFQRPRDKINAVLNYFRNESFFYTLEPPPLRRDSVDDFLFNTRAGFCEHYASSFTVLMRQMGIPARVVIGYQGGTFNTQDGYLEVRQSDAHAWAEVWLENEGWVRVDPTAAVAPDRILKNLSATQKSNGITGIVDDIIGQNSFANEIRMRWSALNNKWNQWVLNYNETKQSNLLQNLGLKDLEWMETLIALLTIGTVVIGISAIPLLRRQVQVSPIDQLYLALCKKLEHHGIIKPKFEGPLDFLNRLERHLSPEDFTIARRCIEIYIENKYGPHNNANSIANFKRLLKLLR